MAQVEHLRSAVVNCNSTGDNTLIAAVAGRTIKVKALSLTFTTATNVTFYSAAAGTALSGTFDLQANSSMYEGDTGNTVYTCNPGEAFVLNQSGTASIQGYVKYQLL